MSARSQPAHACCGGWRSCPSSSIRCFSSPAARRASWRSSSRVRSFADLERLTAEGLAAGIAIGELNARRTRHSLIKGGRLTARLQGRPARALFISDVPGDDPRVIGSGLLGPAAEGPDRVERTVVASIDHAVETVVAAALELGLAAEPSLRRFDGDVMRLAVRFAHELDLSPVEVRVWGGESTVQLPENPGRGGRNQHLGLAVARLIAGHPDLMLLAAGTDGTDGVTDDAGALVDAETCARLSLAELDADSCLRRRRFGHRRWPLQEISFTPARRVRMWATS